MRNKNIQSGLEWSLYNFFRFKTHACLANHLILIICCATIASPAWSEGIYDVYLVAVEEDPILGAASASLQINKERLPQARSALLPSIGGSVSTSNTTVDLPDAVDQNPLSPTFGQNYPSQKYNDHGWNAQLRQSVFNPTTWFAVGSASSSVQAAQHEFKSQQQELIIRVLQAYLNILRAQDRLDTTKAEITAVKRQLEQVQQRFDVGLVAITDVLDSQAAYDNAVVRGIQAEGDYAISFETLSTLTGRSYESLNRLDESLPIVDPNPSQEDEWVNTALENNYGVKAARAQLKAARRDKRAKQSSHLPTVDATVTQVESVTGGRNFLGADTTQSTVYGLQLSWPLYTGGLTRSRVRQANATAEQASELLLSQQLNVTRDTRNLYKSVTTDVVRVQARLKAIRSSQSALEATETGYEVGTRNIVDVLQAQQRLFGSQFDYADSRYTYLLNLMRLKQSAGTLSEADLKELNSYMSPVNPVRRVISASTIN